MIKTGQVYQHKRTPEIKLAILYTEDDLGLVYCVKKCGMTFVFHDYIFNDYKLVAEFDTWQKAVNSREFNR